MADTPENPTRISGASGWTPLAVERLQEVLPAYEVISLLGAGGMGAVYQARQKSLKRLVAIKILPTAGAEEELQFVERFRNEAQTLAQMNHPAIVNVYDFGETPNGLLYFVMEFVDGTDVHKMIQSSGKLSSDHALSITAHVCDALAYAHRNGVIHRDIKPANILINREGHVKVADFGLAKMHDPAQSGLTMTGMAMGTPDYAAPEVFKDVASVDHRADLYAVGVMLYQMLTGEVPRGFFKLPSESGADPRFDAIIVKAMEANRDERFQSALEVRHALDEILTTPLAKNDGTGAISARSLPQRSRVAQARSLERSAPSLPERAQPGSDGAPPSKAPLTQWLIAAAIVAVLGVVGLIVMNGKKKPTAEAQPPTSERAISPPPFLAPKAGTIDLLALVDVKRDVIAGEWTRTADGMLKQASATSGAARLQLPYQPPEEYDFEIEFTPESGTGSVDQALSAFGRQFAWKTDVRISAGAKAGFEMVAGESVVARKDGTKLRPKLLTNGQRHRVRVAVRKTGLSGFLDGELLVKWGSNPDSYKDLDIGAGQALRDARHIGIATWNRAVTFHKIEVREVAGTGEVDAGVATASNVKGRVVDLLPLVEVKRDTVAGEWSREGGDLLVKADKPDANGTPRLQLPYQPPEEYDFEIEFTPESGTNMVGQVLSAYQRSFAWFLDAKTNAGSKAGFDALDGVGVASRTDGTTMRPKFLTNGQRHRSTVEVRRNRVRALLDGEPLVTWGASPKSYERLDISKNEKLRDALHLGLIAYDRAVRFHKLTVREITGTGKVNANTAAASPVSGKPETGMIDWINSPPSTMSTWSPEWQLKDGMLTPSTQRAMQFGLMKDGLVRLRVRLRPNYMPDDQGPQLQLTIRSGSLAGAPGRSGHIQFQTYVPNRTASVHFQDKTTPGLPVERLLDGKPKKASDLASREVEWEFRAVGDEYTARVDGELVASVRDPRVASGYCVLDVRPGIQITRLETAGLTPTKSSASPKADASSPASPAVSNWQDVTGSLKEQAKAKPGFSIEGALIAWTGDTGNPPRIDVTPAGRNDYAIRLKHIGAGQINVRMNEKGFVYVQSASTGLRINRWMKGVTAPVSLIASQPIPFSYSKGEPHDLIVTVQGSTIRAWLDGQLMGTVEDTTFAEGTGAIAFVSYGKVQKVEVGDLSAGTDSTQWQPIFNQPSDFGGDLRDVEFRDGAMFIRGRSLLPPAEPPLAAIRSTLRYLEGDRTGSLTIRSTESAQYGEEDFGLTAFIAPTGGANLVVKLRDRPAGVGNGKMGRHDFPLSPALKEGELFTFELRAEGKKITVSINGRVVGSVDDSWTGAPRRFGITPSNTEMTEFRDVAVQVGR